MFHSDFKEINRHLAIKSKDGYDKFCNICCYKVQGKANKLLQHLSGQHGLEEGCFLEYGSQSKECIYQNFDEYLANPNVPLKLKVGAKIRRGKKPKNMKKDDRTCSEDT